MRDLCFFIILCLSAISCGDKNQQKDINNQNNIPKIDTISYELKSISKEFGDCGDNGIKCAKAVLKYVVLNKTSNSPNLTVINETIENTLRASAPSIAASLDSFIIEAKTFFLEFPDVPGGYALELDQSVILNTKELLTVEEFSYSYTGGAHGNYGTGFYNFDVRNGALVGLKDILETGYELPLKTMAESIFRKKYLKEGMTKYSEAGFYFENDEFSMTDNFAITKEGLKFVYNPYEIAPYAMGQQEILIPHANLTSIIKKDGLLNNLK